MNKYAFTLIELLIVVAIIGILAAIAVPNFLNAQIKARVSRSLADMKTTVTGIEQLRLERGVLLVDFWDDDTDWGRSRIRDIFGGVGDLPEASRRQVDVLSPITSPVAYLSSVPKDPFAPKTLEDRSSGHSERFGQAGNDVYLYMDNDPQGSGGDSGGTRFDPPLKEGDYVVTAFGPAAGSVYTSNGVRFGIPYDASNGLVSIGDIMMKTGGSPIQINNGGR